VKVIAGLGNPGRRYAGTRHNAGFMVLDRLADRLKAAFDREKYHGLVAEADYAGERLLLLKPQTYMNSSGESVARAVRYKGLEPVDLLVVVEEGNLPLGRLRVRASGSAGGHNGLKSIIERLGDDGFPRLRLGVGEPGLSGDLTNYVLGSFTPDQRAALEDMTVRAIDAALCWALEGVAAAMNKFN